MRKKCHVGKRWILSLLICSIMVNWFYMPEFVDGNIPFEVLAKVSKSVKRKAARAYREDLYEGDYTWFRVMDMDGDGLKELVLSYEPNPTNLIIYKYRKGRTYQVGEDSTSFGYYYNKKTRRICGAWGGCGNIEDWYLTCNKRGKLKRVYLQMLEKEVVNGKVIYDYRYAGKKISRKAYLRKKRSWNRNAVPLKMYKTSMRNIRKYVR